MDWVASILQDDRSLHKEAKVVQAGYTGAIWGRRGLGPGRRCLRLHSGPRLPCATTAAAAAAATLLHDGDALIRVVCYGECFESGRFDS